MFLCVATHLAILYADRRDRPIKSPIHLACQISATKFAGIRQVCPFPRFSMLIVASHAVVFRGLVLPPPHKRRLWGGGNTSPLKTTAWEAMLIAANRQSIRMGYFIRLLFKMVDSCDQMEPGNKLEVPHRRDRRKKSPSVSASIGDENLLRFSLAIKFAAIGE